MRLRKFFQLCLCIGLFLASQPTATASASGLLAPVRQTTPIFQGEIAYVLNGDIWLHDLPSGKARQLTTGGNKLAPRWSPNGRYLLYSYGPDLESSDLYLLDVDSGGPAQLLVSQACCGSWSPDSWRIAYIALGGDELSVNTVLPDGSGKETLFSPLTFARGSYPTGTLDWVDEEHLVVPLEVIGESSLDVYRDVFTINLSNDAMDKGVRQGDCSVLSRDVATISGDTTGGLIAEALAFERAGETCVVIMQSVAAPKGVDLVRYDGGQGRELPWLAAPSLSADGLFLAAERYAESDDPATSMLWGVVAVNLLDASEQEVASGASQPAWRPAPALDPVALRFVQPDERLVTLNPPLQDGDKLYRISYLTTGDIQQSDAQFLHEASPDFFTKQEITGFVITADDTVVTDPATLRRIFDLYHAAYHLYLMPPPDLIPLLGKELDSVLTNELLTVMEPEKFLTSRRNQTAAALRAMLTVSDGGSQVASVFDKALAGTPGNAQDALNAIGRIIEDQHAANGALVTMQADLETAYQASGETANWGENSLAVLRLIGDLVFVNELESERAGWLQSFVDTFSSGTGSMDRDQLRAAATILEEVDNAKQQRANLVLDFINDKGTSALLETGATLTQKEATDLVVKLAAKYGMSVSTQAVAKLLSTVSVGLTVNSILYGSDDLVANFQLAKRAEELRTVFRAASDEVQLQIALRANADVPPVVFDGAKTTAYRTAMLLDTLAGVAAQRAYADGVVASQRIPNLLALINKLRGEDWEIAAKGLRQRADEAERQILDDLAGQTAVDSAVTLALVRTRPQSPSAGGTLVEPVTGMTFVRVPAGEFLMGSTKEQVDVAYAMCQQNYDYCDRNSFYDEQPQHSVFLDEYWIGQTEVTTAQYKQFMDASGYNTERYWSADGWAWRNDRDAIAGRSYCWGDVDFEETEHPIICVTWYEAEAFTNWLTEVTGVTMRLPSEAEWEKAARSTDGRTFPWGEDLPDGKRLNFCDVNCEGSVKDATIDDGYASTAPVGSYLAGASPYGVQDMAGNVWEWVNDWYQDNYYQVSPDSNPQGPITGDLRVLRGGSWYGGTFDEGSSYERSASRDARNPNIQSDNWGIRVTAEISGSFPVRQSDGAASSKIAGDPILDNAEMMLVPAGSFEMGCQGCTDENVGPLHKVNLSAYYIDKYEVTNARYKACVDAGVCTPPMDIWSSKHTPYYGNPTYVDYPVINVTWQQAHTYCQAVGKRLPTEAEWEKAARGDSDRRPFPWGNDTPSCDNANLYYSWLGIDCVGDTSEVGSYPTGASPYGVMDMAGNVQEWVNDWYQLDYYRESPDSSPEGPKTGTNRVIRGGGWGDNNVSSISRGDSHPESWSYGLGFRCVRSP